MGVISRTRTCGFTSDNAWRRRPAGVGVLAPTGLALSPVWVLGAHPVKILGIFGPAEGPALSDIRSPIFSSIVHVTAVVADVLLNHAESLSPRCNGERVKVPGPLLVAEHEGSFHGK